MESDSESQGQGDVAASNRAGVGNPQDHHQEIHGYGESSDAAIPRGARDAIT